MAKDFYYQVMGEVIGPISGMELRQKALDQTIAEDTLVRVGADGDWVAAKRLKGLFDEHGNPMSRPTSQPQNLDHKTCPYCAESIMASAIKCRYCGEFLEGARPTPTPDSPPTPPDGSRLRSCPDCGHQVSKHAQQCPSCGRPFEGPLQERAPTPASATAPPATTARASAPAPPSAKPEDDGPAPVKTDDEVTANIRVALIGLAVICWGIVVLLFASDPEEHQHWFVPVLITAIVCGMLGAIIGSFKNAGDIGGMLGATFGPLGVIGVLAIDGRPQCPKCGGRLDGKPEVCPHCHLRIVFPKTVEQRAESAAECPICDGSIVGQPSTCTHCSFALKWVNGRPTAREQIQLVGELRKLSRDLLRLIDMEGFVCIRVELYGSQDVALKQLQNIGFVRQDLRSFIDGWFTTDISLIAIWLFAKLSGSSVIGRIEASRLRELAALHIVARVRPFVHGR